MQHNRVVTTLEEAQQEHFLNEWPLEQGIRVTYRDISYKAHVHCLLAREVGYFIGDFSGKTGNKLEPSKDHIAYTAKDEHRNGQLRRWVLVPVSSLTLHTGENSSWMTMHQAWQP